MVKIEGPVTGIPSVIIYLWYLGDLGVNKPLYESTNQWEKDIYDHKVAPPWGIDEALYPLVNSHITMVNHWKSW